MKDNPVITFAPRRRSEVGVYLLIGSAVLVGLALGFGLF